MYILEIALKQKQIVFTTFRLIWIQTEVRLYANQLEIGKYNLISGWFYKISKLSDVESHRQCIELVFLDCIFM